jgi:LacI family transcriptional regulator
MFLVADIIIPIVAFDQRIKNSGTLRKASGQHLAQELLVITPAIDALFVVNNLMAMGALDAIHARKLRVPEEIAFVGYNELPWVAPGFGSLTTVAQPV